MYTRESYLSVFKEIRVTVYFGTNGSLTAFVKTVLKFHIQ